MLVVENLVTVGTTLPEIDQLGFTDRFARAGAAYDSAVFSLAVSYELKRGSLRHKMLDSALRSVVDSPVAASLRDSKKVLMPSAEKKSPRLLYSEDESTLPDMFTDESLGYFEATPELRSMMMRENLRVAMEMVRWSSAKRMHSFPSLVNSDQLLKLLFSELDELKELNGVDPKHHTNYSLLQRVLQFNDNDVRKPWYKKENALAAFEVTGELVDTVFCCIQHWLVYDSLTIEQCVEHAEHVMRQFDRVSRNGIDNADLLALVENYSLPLKIEAGIPQPESNIKPVWPEFYFGMMYLLSKKVGVDLSEALILKSFANDRHYPAQLRLEEKVESSVSGDRLMDQPRPPAWQFMKNTRREFSPDKRFIPPMAEPFVRETVLDKLYKSPYAQDLFSLLEIAGQAYESGVAPVITKSLAEINVHDWGGNKSYYLR